MVVFPKHSLKAVMESMDFTFGIGTIVSRKDKCVHAHTYSHAEYTNEPDVCPDTKLSGNYLDHRISKRLSPKFSR